MVQSDILQRRHPSPPPNLPTKFYDCSPSGPPLKIFRLVVWHRRRMVIHHGQTILRGGPEGENNFEGRSGGGKTKNCKLEKLRFLGWAQTGATVVINVQTRRLKTNVFERICMCGRVWTLGMTTHAQTDRRGAKTGFRLYLLSTSDGVRFQRVSVDLQADQGEKNSAKGMLYTHFCVEAKMRIQHTSKTTYITPLPQSTTTKPTQIAPIIPQPFFPSK